MNEDKQDTPIGSSIKGAQNYISMPTGDIAQISLDDNDGDEACDE